MNPEKNIETEEEKLEVEEQTIGEPINVLEQDEPREYVPTHEMTNEEIDHYKPVTEEE